MPSRSFVQRRRLEFHQGAPPSACHPERGRRGGRVEGSAVALQAGRGFSPYISPRRYCGALAPVGNRIPTRQVSRRELDCVGLKIAGAPGPCVRTWERTTTLNSSFVTGHDFSRAVRAANVNRALAPAGNRVRARQVSGHDFVLIEPRFMGAPGPSLLGTGEGNPDGRNG
jgi:hypothetical protein